MPEREVTIGELAEDVTDLASAIRELRASLEEKYLRKEMYEMAHEALVAVVATNNQRHDSEIRALEARQTWIGRTAVTALLLPLVVFVVTVIVIGSYT